MIAWNGLERYRIGADILTEKEYDYLNAFAKCPLGEDWTQKVKAANIACKWMKIPILKSKL